MTWVLSLTIGKGNNVPFEMVSRHQVITRNLDVIRYNHGVGLTPHVILSFLLSLELGLLSVRGYGMLTGYFLDTDFRSVNLLVGSQ